GPQSSGLIVGEKSLIQACNANNYPNNSIGRSMKLDKETIAGIVKAVELFARKDYDVQMKVWEETVADLIVALSALTGLEVRRGFPVEPGVQPVMIPRVYITTTTSVNARELQARLAQLNPV